MPKFRNQPIDVVLDVRSKLEYWLGHLPNATCIAVDALEDRLPEHPEITKDSRILVYCQSGARSAAAKGILNRLGYTRVVDGGGIAAASAEFAA